MSDQVIAIKSLPGGRNHVLLRHSSGTLLANCRHARAPKQRRMQTHYLGSLERWAERFVANHGPEVTLVEVNFCRECSARTARNAIEDARERARERR